MTGSADLLPIFVAISLVLAGLGRLRGSSPASWSTFPYISAAIFGPAFVYAQLAAADLNSADFAATLSPAGAVVACLIVVGLAVPLIVLYSVRKHAAGIAVVFAMLFALDAAEQFGLTVAGVVIARPLGYSYLLFRFYDALRNPRPEWRANLLQVTAFPTLAAGPILLYGQSRSLRGPLAFDRPVYQRAIFLLALGIVKLYVLLPFAQIHLETGLIWPLSPSLFALTNAAQSAFYAYLRLFLDFSGYTDLVVAMCGLMGYKIRHNFLRPYAAVSLRDFWRRWHITLAAFMRRHLYEPLGGRSSSFSRYAKNIVIVFALLGLWHGLTLHFLFWGLLHAGYMLVEARFVTPAVRSLIDRGDVAGRCGRCGQYILTQSFVAFSWLVFFWK